MSQMIVHTCFNNSSYHGYKSSILKSGICKYTRRGEKEKMKWCVMEMARFNEHEKAVPELRFTEATLGHPNTPNPHIGGA